MRADERTADLEKSFGGSAIAAAHKDFGQLLRPAGWRNFFKSDLVEGPASCVAFILQGTGLGEYLRFAFRPNARINESRCREIQRAVQQNRSTNAVEFAQGSCIHPKDEIGIKVDNRILLAGEGEGRFAIGGGQVLRIFFHGLTPRFMIEHLGRRLTSSMLDG